MLRKKLSILFAVLAFSLVGVNFIHAQDVVETPVATVEVTEAVSATPDKVEVPVPSDPEDNSGTIIVTYNAFSNIFKIILAIVVAGGAFSLGTIALIVRQVRQDKDVIEAARKLREKQSPIINDGIDGLTELLTEVALLLKSTRDPNAPPIDPVDPVG